MEDFVILFHEIPTGSGRASHWDLMLRSGNSLLTWECHAHPLENQSVNCRRLANHRLEYLKYEGILSGDRGSVERVAAGQFEWVTRANDDNWKVRLFRGQVMATLHMKNSSLLVVQPNTMDSIG